jgi:orotate phosphoribosyltransferase
LFTRIKREGNFILKNGIRSAYDYDYATLSDTMNAAYCRMLKYKLDKWQEKHGKLNVVIGLETQGIRVGYELAEMLGGLPFYILPHKITDFARMEIPKFPPDTHWLIVDDIVTSGLEMLRAVNFLNIEERPETFTFACMIRRNPKNLDYSPLKKDGHGEQFHVPEERVEVVDRRLVALYCEAE